MKLRPGVRAALQLEAEQAAHSRPSDRHRRGARPRRSSALGMDHLGDLGMARQDAARPPSALAQCARMRSGSVSSPWMNRKALNGLIARAEVAQQRHPRLDDVGDRAQRLDRLRSTPRRDSSGRAVFSSGKRSACSSQSKLPPSTRMPPIEVPWPPIYLVVECMTIAAPWSSGRQSTGAAVLSMISGTPSSRPILRDLGDREHGELRVGQRLGVVAAGLGVGGAAEILRVGRIDEAAPRCPSSLHRVGEQVPGAAVEVGRGDEIVAGLADVLDREQRGRLARAQRQRRDAAFERGDALSPARRWSGS